MSSKSDNESKFGFKDRSKAEETLQLLDEHDMQYRKLTVRGLLGRAKRVLSMTKAEDKVRNIKEAMQVFEQWLEENGGGANSKNSKTDSNDKVETVPGLGFKNREAAEKTLQILDGRDPDYQKLAIRGLIGSSKRVLSGTKSEEKISAIKEGVKILEDFLEKFDNLNMSKDNMAYLSYDIMSKFSKPSDNKLVCQFIDAYAKKAKCNYKHLRTMYPEDDDTVSWDIIRNRELKKIREQIKTENLRLFSDADSGGKPTDEHLQMIHWAYSPQLDKLKNYVKTIEPAKAAKKRKSSGGDDDDDDDNNDDDDDVDNDEDDDDDNSSKGSDDDDDDDDDDEDDDDVPKKKKSKLN